MSENLIIDINASKFEKYEALLPQIESLIAYETSLTANLANVSAALREAFGWWWVGFYLVDGEELVLGPFQGPVACTRIRFGRGVCGTAWKEAKSQLVPDVEKFPGHIACSSASVSEIVIPVIDKNGKVLAVLDVDSERYDVLDETDVHYLEKLVAMV
ncbi:MAG: GAF domain-containing protein, partial [Paludibacter sp.]|nr:GAF domain-containing protein [Paludibacter sp.]